MFCRGPSDKHIAGAHTKRPNMIFKSLIRSEPEDTCTVSYVVWLEYLPSKPI